MDATTSEISTSAHLFARSVAGPVRIVTRLAALLEPWLLLVMRVWLGQAFLALFVAAMLAPARGLAATLTGGWWVDLLRHIAASGFGNAIQAVCPLLIIVGLVARPAAALLIIQAALLDDSHARLHGLWILLLVCLVVRGPGRLSLDGVLGPGAADSALPGVRIVVSVHHWLARRGTPTMLLVLRLAIAGTLLFRADASPLLSTDGASQHSMARAMIAMLPMPTGFLVDLPSALLVLCAAALVAGLCNRFVAVALMIAGPIGDAGSPEALYWLLTLGVLVVDGAGALAVDAWLDERLRGMVPAPRSRAHRVVIVGGGFGGRAVARGLCGRDCDVTLVDRHNYHLFQPLLYQVATAGLSPADIAAPIRALFREYANVRVVLGTVTGVDRAARHVEIEDGPIGFDTLVIATGARHAYFGHEEWSAFAPGLKTIDDATAIRRRLLLAFERAEVERDERERAAWLTFVVVGGGPTGVELAGAIAELARKGMAGNFRSIDPAASRVVLIQSAPRLLPAFPETLSDEAAASLRRLGVEVVLDDKATTIDPTGVTTGRAFIPARNVLWAAGVQASPAAAWLGAEADGAGRVVVGPDLRVPGHPDVFVIGDTCASKGWAGRPVPGLAPAAQQAGTYVARVIRAGLGGRRPPPAFAYRHRGSLATIGRKAAVADFGRLHFKGATAWWLWGVVHVLFLVEGRGRARVTVEWLWDYLTLRRGTRLITGESLQEPGAGVPTVPVEAERPPVPV